MRTRGVFHAVVFVAAALTMCLVIVFSRLFSAVLGAELVLWAPGLALFGGGLGAAWAGLRAGRLAPPRLLSWFGGWVGAGSFATLVATIGVLKIAPPEGADLADPWRLAIVAALATTPFFCLGAALAAAHAHARSDAPRLGAFDLAGAAVAIPLAVGLLRSIGAPRAALGLALAMAILGVVCAMRARRARPDASPAAAWGLLMGISAVLAGDLGAPWLRLTHTRGAKVDRVEFSAWSELGLVTVDIPSKGGTAWIHTDGVGTSGVLPEKTAVTKHPDQIGYALQAARGPREGADSWGASGETAAGDQGPVMIVGAGGGRDVRAALEAGATQIFATEVNGIVVDRVVRERLREHAGDLYDRPEVKVIVTDARGYAARNRDSFRTIVASLVDTGSAGSAATLVRSESGLYTVEGVGTLVRALVPGGALVVNRWDDEAPRLVALAAESLRSMGTVDPRAHLFACSHQRSTALLVARDPLAEPDVRALRAFCKKGRFKEVLAPDRAREDLEDLLADPRAAYASSERDLTPPTDDRPFYFHGVRPDRLLAALLDPEARRRESLLVPAALLAGLGLAALVLLAAVAGLVNRRAPRRAPGGLLFFASAGAAYALLQASLVQRLASFVAHPSHALLVVLLALVAGGALGARLVRGVEAVSIEGEVARRAQLLAAVVAVLALLVGPLLAAGASLSAGARSLLAGALCLPLGVLAGALTPLALRALSSWAPARAALASAVGGAAMLLGTGLGALLALHVGLSFLLLLAAVLYLVASVVNPAPAHRGA